MIRYKVFVKFFEKCWFIIMRGDFFFFKKVLVLMLTVIQTVENLSSNEQLIQILFIASNIKDATIRAKSVDLLSMYIQSQYYRYDRIVLLVYKSLSDSSKKVKISSLKGLQRIFQNYFLTRSLADWSFEISVQQILLKTKKILSTPKMSPSYNKDCRELAKNFMLQCCQNGCIDKKIFADLMSFHPNDEELNQFLSLLIRTELNRFNLKEGCIWWCELVSRFSIHDILRLESTILLLDHDTLEIWHYLDSMFESKYACETLKLCILFYSKNSTYLCNNREKFVEMLISKGLQKESTQSILSMNQLEEEMHLCLQILLRMGSWDLMSSSRLEELITKSNFFVSFLKSDDLRQLMIRLVFKIFKTPRRIIFTHLEQMLQKIYSQNDLDYFLRALKDVFVENVDYVKSLAIEHFADGLESEKSLLKESIEKILDEDIQSNYLSRFINSIIIGASTGDSFSNNLKMMFTFCLGNIFCMCPTIAKTFFPRIMNSLMNDSLKSIQLLAMIIGADMIRTIPNEAKCIRDQLFDPLVCDNTEYPYNDHSLMIHLLLLEHLSSERLINVDDKMHKIAYLVTHQSLGPLSSRIIGKYLNRSGCTNVFSRNTYNLCMSVILDSPTSQIAEIIKILIEHHLDPNAQRKLSSMIMKGILTRLDCGRSDPMLEKKCFLLSHLKKSQGSSLPAEKITKLLKQQDQLLTLQLFQKSK